jgi:hypothetical protein
MQTPGTMFTVPFSATQAALGLVDQGLHIDLSIVVIIDGT